jgi:regulatory protein
MLARRELSEAQVRQRLARKGHDEDAVERAVARLKAEGAIDDARVAEAMAHSAVSIKRRGPRRIRQEIEQAGIARGLARQATEAIFDEVDAGALLERSLAARLRGRARIADRAEFRRLYRYLTAQGFESDAILAALTARMRG